MEFHGRVSIAINNESNLRVININKNVVLLQSFIFESTQIEMPGKMDGMKQSYSSARSRPTFNVVI